MDERRDSVVRGNGARPEALGDVFPYARGFQFQATIFRASASSAAFTDSAEKASSADRSCRSGDQNPHALPFDTMRITGQRAW
jgi:hypothetical protein